MSTVQLGLLETGFEGHFTVVSKFLLAFTFHLTFLSQVQLNFFLFCLESVFCFTFACTAFYFQLDERTRCVAMTSCKPLTTLCGWPLNAGWCTYKCWGVTRSTVPKPDPQLHNKDTNALLEGIQDSPLFTSVMVVAFRHGAASNHLSCAVLSWDHKVFSCNKHFTTSQGQFEQDQPMWKFGAMWGFTLYPWVCPVIPSDLHVLLKRTSQCNPMVHPTYTNKLLIVELQLVQVWQNNPKLLMSQLLVPRPLLNTLTRKAAPEL